MKIRDAKVTDIEAIHGLITEYAEMDRMLFRSISNMYEDVRSFVVAEVDTQIVGCCALKVIWEDLGEIQSLAVKKDFFGRGLGRALVDGCVERARNLGLEKLFTLTLEPGFFEKNGFLRVDRGTLPMKVWSDCARCPKQDQCDEVSMIRVL
ncbi:MAG: N-acetyltransferase [Sedimentisphaerales bacterium]|nr:N-acetyltransferase [Sedimentisphaerales bacterium]